MCGCLCSQASLNNEYVLLIIQRIHRVLFGIQTKIWGEEGEAAGDVSGFITHVAGKLTWESTLPDLHHYASVIMCHSLCVCKQERQAKLQATAPAVCKKRWDNTLHHWQ